ncbi:MAG: hypothetical protein JJT96_11320 [Opitutales bacterium]|nr:hypothetical protein [Opitutales bacterium]
MKVTKTLSVIVILACAPVVISAQLGGLKRAAPSSAPASAESSQTDALSADAMQQELVRDFLKGNRLILQANRHFLEALVGKEEAEKYFLDAQAISGDDLSKGNLEKATVLTSATSAAVEEFMQKGEELSDEAKAEFARGLVPYAKGVYETAKLRASAQRFSQTAQQEIRSANVMNASRVRGQLEGGLYVATQLPGYLKSLTDSTSAIFEFARNQGIEVPADATAALQF